MRGSVSAAVLSECCPFGIVASGTVRIESTPMSAQIESKTRRGLSEGLAPRAKQEVTYNMYHHAQYRKNGGYR